MFVIVPVLMYLHSFSSQILFSLSMLYLSAATSRCWHMTSSSSFSVTGKESVYAKQSNDLNTSASISSMRTTPAVSPSFIPPKSSALKTGDRAASTHRCAAKVLPPTSKTTSAPFSVLKRLPRCRCRSDGATVTNAGGVSWGRSSAR
uniref:Uncharacterized protein n=1 Tax=Triticum urartu TaxID=4572 RepID=A0A8R7R5N1_TRIUA